ncbi:type 1 glutamine amidotransferase domain-containing protein [Staphylococcus sp. EZ-P03]|uniref:type 1 glutamine amidotransferase domain-containing protein n=1 Tax=Staphylococcus sp. EZ-P03 TaxID=2282739 RepID=UPI000DF79DF8|nr:type 1 glutamine amidotransferase domain-containing protein [Staphylococcus sp. EZ-P03]
MPKKVLIVNTSVDHFENFDVATGLWLGELVHFYDVMHRNHIQMDIVNTKGGATPIDPVSTSKLMLDKLTKQYQNNQAFMQLLETSPSIKTINPKDYDAVYFTGGHGVMYDFPGNPDIQRVISKVREQGGIVSAVCHGICAFLDFKDTNGVYYVSGKKLTGFSNFEEKLAHRKKLVPFMLEDQLFAQGADYTKAALPFRPYTVTDYHLVTGQNPQSPKRVAKKVLALLNAKDKIK